MDCYRLYRPALFLLPPEKAHRAAIRALQMGVAPKSQFTHPSLATELAGLKLPSPVGLAAGFDKNAEAVEGLQKAGFGFVEIGTVTPRAQPGNPAPRMFRLVEHEAVINRLGFNNEGMDAAAARLAANRHGGVVGGNVGKNKDSEQALPDYVAAMRALYGYVDYITANISSPNTPGLRNLQAKEELQALVRGLHAARTELMQEFGFAHKPIFVKIAPDNDDAALIAIAQVALEETLDGLIISNTTIQHNGEQGGLSGKPLFTLSTEVLRKVAVMTKGQVPLIGVGGISSAEDAYAKIRAGASAVQLYTGLIYQGLGLVERINKGLVELLARDGFASVAQAVGVDRR
ncbi:MAG: dihydroorotate dehydrogenase (quinone) [Azospirillum brasilense]|nr:MAG: dihydroorotate dehydrogenase (quinone) [Azospirillum brasilense]